jgi:hypothetical protein
MSFQAYLDNIQAKTGKSRDELRELAAEKGFSDKGGIKVGVKAAEIVAWRRDEFQLGHGHAMAIVALLKGKRE